MELLPLKNRAKKLVNVKTPKAPTWISNASMRMPAGVNVDAMSTVVSPVMHTALVETKTASRKEIPSCVHYGNDSSTEPMLIKKRKLPANSKVGFVRLPIILRNPKLTSSKE